MDPRVLDYGLHLANKEYYSVSTIKNKENIVEALNEDVKAWSLGQSFI